MGMTLAPVILVLDLLLVGAPVLRKSYHKRIDSELKKEYKRYMAEVYSCNKNTLYYKADAIGQLERLKALFVNLHPKFKVVAS
jgi:predicted aconitase